MTSVVDLGHYVGGAGGLNTIIVKLKKSRYNLVAKNALESSVLFLNITLKCHYDQNLDINFFTISYTIGLS